VEIELRADRHIGADDGADALDEVGLARLGGVGDHRATQAEQHGIDRHRLGEIRHDLVAKSLVDPLHGRARRHCEGGEALRHAPTPRPRAVAELDHRQREEIGRGAVGTAAHQRGLGEQSRAGRDGRERVGLGAKRGVKRCMRVPLS
jgi:hypothetical protein